MDRSSFDNLPDSAHVRQSEIIPSPVPVSPSTLWRWVAEGLFPRPIKLGPRVTAWKVSSLREWMAQRAEKEAA
jgi:prophage regulatory protein